MDKIHACPGRCMGVGMKEEEKHEVKKKGVLHKRPKMDCNTLKVHQVNLMWLEVLRSQVKTYNSLTKKCLRLMEIL